MKQSEVALRGNLRIRKDLKQDIKVAAAQRGLHEYQLIEEVWKFWLDRNKLPVATPLQSGHRTEEETRSAVPSSNNVKILVTTGQAMHEVQNWADEADVIVSVYPGDIRLLKGAPKDIVLG